MKKKGKSYLYIYNILLKLQNIVISVQLYWVKKALSIPNLSTITRIKVNTKKKLKKTIDWNIYITYTNSILTKAEELRWKKTLLK